MAPPRFFSTPAMFRAWLQKNHESEKELLVGFYRTSSGKRSITWSESVSEALCFGWIDGIRKSLDGESYTIRFTPRKPKSIWSNVNIAKVKALIAEGRMAPAGLAAWALRTEGRSGVYSFEGKALALDADLERGLKRNRAAWTFFSAQPPSYRRLVSHHVASARKAETRTRRLEALIRYSEAGERMPQFVSAPRRR
ncbi:MAG: YdeI/OmpD-associated family protein [Gemmatimonadaceae bacterium]